jgi:hypothetical protein
MTEPINFRREFVLLPLILNSGFLIISSEMNCGSLANMDPLLNEGSSTAFTFPDSRNFTPALTTMAVIVPQFRNERFFGSACQ